MKLLEDYIMNIKRGSIVYVRGGFGLNEPKKVVVMGIGEKNGKPLFDYEDNNLMIGDIKASRWAYFNQIEKVIKY